MKKIFFGLATLFAFLPNFASAHVKWFIENEQALDNTTNQQWFSVTDPAVLIWIAVTIIAIITAWYLDKKLSVPSKVTDFADSYKSKIIRTAQVILGLFLISTSVLPTTIVGGPPEFTYSAYFGVFLQIVQATIGAFLVFNIIPRIASAILMLITVLLLFTHGFTTFAENSIVLALATFLFLYHSPAESKFVKFRVYGMEIVRIGAGISLLVLSFSEKLINPTLGLAFLEKYQWNFMQPFFPEFTNNLFVLSAGFSELIFGLILILGFVTRLSTMALTVFFALSAITMMVKFGIWEEHSAVYAVVVLLLAFGYGKTRFIDSVLKKN